MSERIPNQVSQPSEEPKIWRRRPGSLKALWTQLAHVHDGSGRVAKQNRGSLMHFHHPVQGQRFRSRGKAFTLQEEKRPFTVTNFPTKYDISPQSERRAAVNSAWLAACNDGESFWIRDRSVDKCHSVPSDLSILSSYDFTFLLLYKLTV